MFRTLFYSPHFLNVVNLYIVTVLTWLGLNWSRRCAYIKCPLASLGAGLENFTNIAFSLEVGLVSNTCKIEICKFVSNLVDYKLNNTSDNSIKLFKMTAILKFRIKFFWIFIKTLYSSLYQKTVVAIIVVT